MVSTRRQQQAQTLSVTAVMLLLALQTLAAHSVRSTALLSAPSQAPGRTLQQTDVYQKRRDTGKIVGGVLAAVVVLVLMAINYKRFIACYRSRRAVTAQKKQLKQQQKLNPAAADADIEKPNAPGPKDPQVTGVQRDPMSQNLPQGPPVIRVGGSSVASDISSRTPTGGMHAVPWMSGLLSQREQIVEVVPDEPPEVLYYQCSDERIDSKPTVYLQCGNTLENDVEAGPGTDEQAHTTGAAVPIYHADSDSFKVWADESAAAAVAAAVAAADRSPQRSAAFLAASLPGSPISSHMHGNFNGSYNSYNNLQGFATPQYHRPMDPATIQQTLANLQQLMTQQQHMASRMLTMSSVSSTSASIDPRTMSYNPTGQMLYGRMSNPWSLTPDLGVSQGLVINREPSRSAPGSRSGTPLVGSPVGSSVAGGFRRARAFDLRDTRSNLSAASSVIDPAALARLGRMDSIGSINSTSSRMRAVSQYGHQNVLVSPFAIQTASGLTAVELSK